MKLLIVILNYRTPDLTIDCLRSLAPEVPSVPSAHVVIVDNASGDDSVERIQAVINQEGWRDWAELLPQDKNHGFAGGNNRGIERYPGAEYVLLLNSDTLVHEGCLAYCIKQMEENASIGALSCLVRSPDGAFQNTAKKFPTPVRMIATALGLPFRWPKLFEPLRIHDLGWDRYTVRREVDWLAGAFLLLRGEALKKVGLLSEAFFFYGEDVELCYRLHKAGYAQVHDPGASITHLGGQSSSLLESSQKANQLFIDARYLIQTECYGRLAAWLVWAVDLGTTFVKRLATRRSPENAQRHAELQAYQDLVIAARRKK